MTMSERSTDGTEQRHERRLSHGGRLLLQMQAGDEIACRAGGLQIAPASPALGLAVFACESVLGAHQAWRCPAAMWVQVTAQGDSLLVHTSRPCQRLMGSSLVRQLGLATQDGIYWFRQSANALAFWRIRSK